MCGWCRLESKFESNGSKYGDLFVVRAGNVDFSCKRLTWKSKYHELLQD